MYTGIAHKIILGLSIATIIGAMVSLVFFVNATADQRVACGVIYAVWTILPPAWFFVEYVCIFDWKSEDLKQWERAQDLARAFWAAVLAAHAVIYLAKFGVKL